MCGCGKRIEVTIPTKWAYRTIKVTCGSTSPYGDPWLCEECEELNAGRDWRREAEEAGETWDEDDN